MSIQIALALTHFLWQGVAIAAILFILLHFLRDASTRYKTCAAALALMCAAPVATFFYLAPSVAPLRGARGMILDTPRPSSGSLPAGWFEANAPLLFWAWLSGVLFLLVRAALAWWRARQVVTQDFEPMAEGMECAARRLAVQLGAKGVQFRVSARVASALVFGWLKPIVVLPAAALGRLTEAEIEALMAHELAHVVRGDFLVNLLQTAAECVLFYHPLVWWVSARMREERELCCDDFAVAVCGDEILYSKALLRLEELRMEPALAATGGRLALRIRRLLTGPESGRITVAPGLALVLLLGVSVALLAQIAPPEQPTPPTPPAAPTKVLEAPEPPVPPPATSATGSTTNYRAGGPVSAPRLVYKVEPDYTPEAQAAHVQGTTVLSAVISPEGTARDIKIVKSLDPGLDTNAVEVVRKWKFEPGIKDGKPVPVIATIEINFRLRDKPPVPPVPAVPPTPGIAPTPAVAPVPPTPRVAPTPAVAPVPRVPPMPAPESATAPEAPVPTEPPEPGEAALAPPAKVEVRGVVGGVPGGAKKGVPGGVVGGVPGGVAPLAPADQSELERRRRYAADRFGGENTDRGEVYMRYGPPDEIDSHPSQGKGGMEMWRYKNTSKAKVMLEIEFQDGKQVKRTGAFAADL